MPMSFKRYISTGAVDDVLSARRWNSMLGDGDDVLPTRYPRCEGWTTWQFPRYRKVPAAGKMCIRYRASTVYRYCEMLRMVAPARDRYGVWMSVLMNAVAIPKVDVLQR